MKKIIKYITPFAFSILFITLCLPIQGLTQVVNPAENRDAPHIYKYSARTGALGDATVGDPTDISSININPATLALIPDFDKVQINVFQNWDNNLMLENISIPIARGNGHNFATQFAMHHNGFNSTNLLGQSSTPQPQLSMYQFDLAYAYNINNVLSLGMFNNISYAQSDVAQYWTYFPTFGIMYAPSRSISYGMAFRGLGRSVTYTLINTEENEQVTTLGSQNLRESLEMGATLHFPVDSDHSHLAVSLANEKKFGQDGVWYKAGVEVNKPNFLALRGGLIFNPDTDAYAPRVGVGLISDVIEVDYMISYEQVLQERYHQLAVILHL